jgi:DNA topoisomerase I
MHMRDLPESWRALAQAERREKARRRRRARERFATAGGSVQAAPEQSARDAGLRHVTDARPGIRRQKIGSGFRYVDAQGHIVRDAETLARIRSLAIPPAWTDVWISPDERGHVQATGRDARTRKQYRYHSRWREVRDETKYDRMLAFATALGKIRRRTKLDLAKPGLPREKVLAAAVQLLEKTLIRVGNDEYARANGSFGLTTLHNRHVNVRGRRVTFRFRGKSGREHLIDLTDPRLAAVVRRCRDLPGQELFAYFDDAGEIQRIGSADVNEYLREISGSDFTAKDFRTWAGTLLALQALKRNPEFSSLAEGKRNVVAAIESVARTLGNTKAVCRKSYIHPALLDAYLAGSLQTSAGGRQRSSRRSDEANLLHILKGRLASDARRR